MVPAGDVVGGLQQGLILKVFQPPQISFPQGEGADLQHDGILFGFCLVHQGIGTVDGLFQRVRRTLQYRTDAQRKVQMGVAGEGGLLFTRNRFRLLCNNFLRGGVKWAKDCNKIKNLV